MSMRVVTFKIEQDLLELMDLMRVKLNMNRSEFIRYTIKYYLDHEYKPNEKIPKAKVEKMRL
jgi:metal-responsive CopG/Arc/MetJ family transcriptional regulator